jgi:hypothetical protein
MNDAQIESFLRKAPRPPAPAGLKPQLLADIRLPQSQVSSAGVVGATPFWRRWFPAFAVGLLFLGCLIVLGVQTSQLLDLRRENATLQAATANLEELRQDNAELQRLRTASQQAERVRKDSEELLKLKGEVAELRDRAAELSALRAENQRLQAERAAAAAKAGIAAEEDPFAKQREKALSTACINNLKQIGLAARLWANDHKTNALPTDWLAMKNELNTPKILTCPADTNRTRATSWDQFDTSSVSYELPSIAPDERDPYTVYSRCPIHGHIGLSDGSAHSGVKSDRFQQVDGNLKLRNNATIGR